MLYRIPANEDGEAEQLTCSSTGEGYSEDLYHANDMTCFNLNGEEYLVVASMACGEDALKVLKVGQDDKVETAGSYAVQMEEAGSDPLANRATGVAFMEETQSGGAKLLVSNAGKLYVTRLDPETANGTLTCTYVGTLDRASAVIDGKQEDLSNWVDQGIAYSNGCVYAPYCDGENRSVVLEYEGVGDENAAANGVLYPNKNVSFRITSKKYSDLFEIEGVDICDGKLFFAANCRAEGLQDCDLVGCFKGFRG